MPFFYHVSNRFYPSQVKHMFHLLNGHISLFLAHYIGKKSGGSIIEVLSCK